MPRKPKPATPGERAVEKLWFLPPNSTLRNRPNVVSMWLIARQIDSLCRAAFNAGRQAQLDSTTYQPKAQARYLRACRRWGVKP